MLVVHALQIFHYCYYHYHHFVIITIATATTTATATATTTAVAATTTTTTAATAATASTTAATTNTTTTAMTTTTTMMMTMMMMIGAGTAELVEVRPKNQGAILTWVRVPGAAKFFFSFSSFLSSRVNFLYRLSHYGVRALSSCAIAFINTCATCTLKVPNTCSHTLVWTQENTAHTDRNNQRLILLRLFCRIRVRRPDFLQGPIIKALHTGLGMGSAALTAARPF